MPRGRPRSFDQDQALSQALEVFWAKGYEGTSLTDLTQAMGINRPSLYAAFGDKQALFTKVLDHYVTRASAIAAALMQGPLPVQEAFDCLLRLSAELATRPEGAKGCLLVHGALCGGNDAEAATTEATARRLASEEMLRERLARAVAMGELPNDTDIMAVSQYFAALQQGMAVLARSGHSRAELERIVDLSGAVWPPMGQAPLTMGTK